MFRILLCTLAVLLLSCACATPNLLDYSGFDAGKPDSRHLKGWSIWAPLGVTMERTTAVSRTGTGCLRIFVDNSMEPNFFAASQRIENYEVGKTYILSAWVKSNEITGGAGAYLSMEFLNPQGNRISCQDTPQFTVGTTDWHRVSATAAIPAGTSLVKANLLLHGHGEAWFDDIQFEEGTTASDWQLSTNDQENITKQTKHELAAAAYRDASGFLREPGKNIAILRDDFPVLGAPANPETLADVLGKAGYRTSYLDGLEFANSTLLSPDNFDLVILPYGSAFPAIAREALLDYLEQGGCFISMGGYTFDQQLQKSLQGWVNPQTVKLVPGPVSKMLFDFEETGETDWWGGHGPGGTAPVLSVVEETGANGKCLKSETHNMRFWSITGTPTFKPEQFFPDWHLLVFRAKATAETKKLFVEMTENDGSRWRVPITLTPQWQEYVLSPEMLSFWADNSPAGRGGSGDKPRLMNLRDISFGISLEVVPDGGDYTFWLDDVRVTNDLYPEAGIRALPINTRTGTINDAMFTEQNQIGVFDSCHPLKDVNFARWTPALGLELDAGKINGPLEGFAAVGVLSNQGHGFGPDNSRLIPLSESFDAQGRPRGSLGSVMFQFDGYFEGSAWAFFGVTNQDLFADPDGAACKMLPGLVERLVGRIYLYQTEAQYACYRAGETAKIGTTVVNYGSQARTVRMKLTVTGKTTQAGNISAEYEETLKLNSGDKRRLEFDWIVPEEIEDIYLIKSTLEDVSEGKSELLDNEDNAVIVWRDNIAAQGPKVEIRDSYFVQDELPKFITGTQTWWGTVDSISLHRPLDWVRDCRMMQDMGFHLMRLFLPWGSEKRVRCSDAWVYLAQKHNIILFHSPTHSGTADPQTLAGQVATAQEIAGRYRNVPGLMFDTCNETGVPVNDSAGQRAAFNEWLRGKYENDTALASAWAMQPPEKLMPEVPYTMPEQTWGNLRARDVSQFSSEALSRWADENRVGFQKGYPGVPVTPGWIQWFSWGSTQADPPLASRNQDFTNQHYYGAVAQFPLHLKPLDRRWTGQPWTLGECGWKQHPSWSDGETEEQFNRRFLGLQHLSFGMGMAFWANWHWRDPMAGIFPCGQLYSDWSLREAGLVDRNQALMFSNLHPKHEAPQVILLLPDENRLSGVHVTVVRGIQRSIDTLLGLSVNFEVACEADVNQLPVSCKAIVWPLAYCPTDATVATLEQFVRQGGSLLITGDISYDTDRQWTKQERLLRLVGAREVVQLSEGMKTEGDLKQVQTSGLLAEVEDYSGYLAIGFKDPQGEVLLASDGLAIGVLNNLDAGRIMFIGEPLELENKAPIREIYTEFFRTAQVERLVVSPDRADLRAFCLPTHEGGQIIILWNQGPRCNATVKVAGHEIMLSVNEGQAAMAMLNSQGQATLVECQGKALIDGQEIFTCTSHAAVMSLDGKSLVSSEQVVLLNFGEGEVKLAHEQPRLLQATMGEVRDGQWMTFTQKPDLKFSAQELTATISYENRLSVVLLTTKNMTQNATAQVVKQLTR